MVGWLRSCAFAPRVFYARSCFGVPLWAGRCRLPEPVCGRWRTRLPEPIGFATERLSPAYYVELRALDIAKEEIELTTPRARHRTPIHPIKLLWPFRWPTPMTTPKVAPPLPPHFQDPRQSINVLI